MTDAEKIKVWSDACIQDMEDTGVLASVSMALILAGMADSPQGKKLKDAHDGNKNRGKPLYPGIAECSSFEQAAQILGDDGTLAELNQRWGLSIRLDKRREILLPKGYKVHSSHVMVYTGPGKNYAPFRKRCKKGMVQIVEEKGGFGRLADRPGWIEMAKCERVDREV